MEKLINISSPDDIAAESSPVQESAVPVPAIWYENGLKVASDGTPRRANGEFASRAEVIAYLGSLVTAYVPQSTSPERVQSTRQQTIGDFGSAAPDLDVRPLHYRRDVPQGAIGTEALSLGSMTTGLKRDKGAHDDLWYSFAGRKNTTPQKRRAA